MTTQSPTVYKIESIPGEGLGMIATSSIPRGSLIIAESPLLTVNASFSNEYSATRSLEQKLQSLSEDQQKEFYTLHNVYGQKHSQVLGIFRTNSLPLGGNAKECSIFLKCSRFNHSCAPNANYSWNGTLGKEVIYAVKDISPGEQITVTYLDIQGLVKVRNDRRSMLQTGFGFNCRCATCGRPQQEVTASDRRRRQIIRLEAEVNDGELIFDKPARALKYCKRILELLKEEGINDITLYNTYFDALQICVMNGDMARASVFAALAVDIRQVCRGHDTPGLESIKLFSTNPEKHPSASAYGKWQTRTYQAQKIGSDGFEGWLWSRSE